MLKSKRDSAAAKQPLSLVWRVGLSGLLLFHLVAVFIPPFTFATSSGPGTGSPFAALIMDALRPYIDLAYLNHGYFFFAPNPGPSHLLRARLEFADGRPAQEIMFPDRKRQWPRLLYHRHFMLAEQLHAEFVPSQPPPIFADDPIQLGSWQRAREVYELRKKSFEDHLRAAYGADRVTLTRVEHVLIAPDQYATHHDLINAPDTFTDLPEDMPFDGGEQRVEMGQPAADRNVRTVPPYRPPLSAFQQLEGER